MAVFKPNNFYPYQQEIDMESLDGNVFSCQVNTDGALVSGARLKILSAIDNTELYENVYQFEVENATINGTTTIRTPYRNKEVAEMFVAPYEIFPEYKEDENGNKIWILSDISFQSLCGLNIDYNKKKDMCPYNFYLVKKNKLSLFKIKVKILDTEGKTTYEDIDFYDFKIIPSDKVENLFNIEFNNNEIFNKYEGLDISYFIVLKNNYDYLWNVRLYEHYFDEQIDNGTFVSDGYITGTTKNVIWYNNNNNNSNSDELETYVKKDNYVEVIADESNSDIFEDQIIEGKKTKGRLQNNNDNNDFSEEQILDNINGYILTDFNGNYVVHSDRYTVTDSGQIILSDKNEKLWNPNSYQEVPTHKYSDGSKWQRYYEIYNTYITTEYESPWYFLNNVTINISDNKNFILDTSQSKIGDIVPRKTGIASSNSYKGNKLIYPLYSLDGLHTHGLWTTTQYYEKDFKTKEEFMNGYKMFPFVVPDCRNYIIVKEIKETEDVAQQYAMNTNSMIMSILDNNYVEKKYYVKILSPLPLFYEFYQIEVEEYNKGSGNEWYYLYYKSNENNLFPLINDTYDYDIDMYCFNKKENGFFNTYNAMIKIDLLYFYYSVANFFKKDYYALSKLCIEPSNNINTYNFVKGCTQTQNIEHSSTYRWSGFYKLPSNFNNDNLPYILIQDYNNSSYSLVIELDTSEYISDNKIYFTKEFEIPYLHNSSLYADIIIPSIDTQCQFGDFTLVHQSKNTINSINLDTMNVDFINYIDNIYIEFIFNPLINWADSHFNQFSYLNNSVQKIKNFNSMDFSITLFDKKYEELLFGFLSLQGTNDMIDGIYNVDYKIIYKQREKIVWTTNKIGLLYDMNKIETENEFKINLKDGATIYLYPCSDKNTYNSFFGIKDDSLNVDNIYIRFPEYEGKDSAGNTIKDHGKYYENVSDNSTIRRYFVNRKYENDCPLDVYGVEVKSEAFENYIDKTDSGIYNGYYCKLFKVSSYDPNTGEFVIAGGLDRIILNTDRYEVWQKKNIEGSSNEYDITEIISTYTRLYPKSNDIDKELYIGGSNLLIEDGIKISNSNKNGVFIQPNINFSSDNNHTPFLKLDEQQAILNFNYKHSIDNIKYHIKDFTINKLDGSQWLLSYLSNNQCELAPGMTYKLYTDWSDSTPSSYFYGRSLGTINLKYGELSEVNQIRNSNNFSILDYEDTLQEYLYNFDNRIEGDYCIISGMDIYMLANINNTNVKIKKYRYKIYNNNMELIWDSLEIWDNLMQYEIKGLENNKIYYIIFECEDEYGYQYFYECPFYSNYSIKNISNNHIDVTPLCSQNAIKIEIYSTYFSLSDYDLQNINEVNIYRKDSTGHTEWINSINFNSDKVYTGDGQNDYKYGFIDYGVRNNEYYDYMFVFDKKKHNLSYFATYQYVIAIQPLKTNFDSWSIVDIIKNQDTGIYEVSGDSWLFRYNLETSEITNNTSVTSWDTLGRYAQMGGGERGYDSSSLTCLLGDVSNYMSFDGVKNILKYGYHEKTPTSLIDQEFEYSKGKTNNIDKYKKWKKYCRNNNLKLLKDISGNMWIVGIAENPTTNINSHSQEQLKTISFQWKEVMGIEGNSIVGRLTSYNKSDFVLNTLMSMINPYWEEYDIKEDYTEYQLLCIKNIVMQEVLIVGSVVFDNIKSQGILVTAKKNEEDDDINSYIPISPFLTIYDRTYPDIKEYIFDDTINFTYNSIDDLFKNNEKIESVKIILDDRLSSAKNAFYGCVNLTTDNGGYIKISSSNYINTLGMFDNTTQNIIVEWDDLLTNKTTNLLTYAELYEQYWNQDNITLNCPQLEFRVNDWEHAIIEESGIDTDDLITYDKIVYLNSYKGYDEQIFVPKYYKENIDKKTVIYKIIIDENFSIG